MRAPARLRRWGALALAFLPAWLLVAAGMMRIGRA